jgi:hypothetical protein
VPIEKLEYNWVLREKKRGKGRSPLKIREMMGLGRRGNGFFPMLNALRSTTLGLRFYSSKK